MYYIFGTTSSTSTYKLMWIHNIKWKLQKWNFFKHVSLLNHVAISPSYQEGDSHSNSLISFMYLEKLLKIHKKLVHSTWFAEKAIVLLFGCQCDSDHRLHNTIFPQKVEDKTTEGVILVLVHNSHSLVPCWDSHSMTIGWWRGEMIYVASRRPVNFGHLNTDHARKV